MSETRDLRGRFSKGYCPNPKGRPRRRTDWSLPTQLRHFIIDLANQPVRITLPNGKKAKMTLFESRVLRLASASGRNRQAHKAFIDLVLQAAGQQEQITSHSADSVEVDTWVSPWVPLDDSDADGEGLSFELWLE